MTLAFWNAWWFYWLLAVALTFGVMEGWSLAAAHRAREKHIEDWTLSDTLRRWSAARRWLAPLVIGTAAMLMWHFFGETNP